jgi:mannose-6-phosphate isomerase-like protein (cupin superfamily)
MDVQAHTDTRGFVVGEDEGDAFWFLNTLTLTKVGAKHTHDAVSVCDHRMPAGFAPPPHVHHGVDEIFYVIDGRLEGFCGDDRWSAGPGSLVFLPRDVPHGFEVVDERPARTLVIAAPGGFDEFVAALGEPAGALELPTPTAPDVARVVALAEAHGMRILPPPGT